MKTISRKHKFLLAVIAGMLIIGMYVLSACSDAGKGAENDVEELGENQYLVYYLDETGQALTSEVYTAKVEDDPIKQAHELWEVMQSPDDGRKHTSTVRWDITIVDTRLSDEVLSVYFTDSYSQLAVEDEVMFRASYVKTMTQIQGIKYVSFYVNEQPLQDAIGNPVGIMLASDFIDDIGSGSYRTGVDLSIYYGNADSDKLAPERITIGYGKEASVERVIIEQLIKGPGEENHIRTVPATLTLLSVKTKDGICYVDFDSVLTDEILPVSPAVTVYSIVNSLCELSNVNKVQISVKSSTNIIFGDTIDLSQPLERSLDIIETSKN